MSRHSPRVSAYSLFARIRGRIVRAVKGLFGIDCYLRTEDRRVLEQVIFPYLLCEEQYRRVLFVGCHWYTRAYNRCFEEKKDYWTIEIDPARKKYGGRRHIIDGMQEIGKYFMADSLDLILCNGVFGWGLDSRLEVEQAFEGSFSCLREGGLLVIGWDDIEERRPFHLEECLSLALFRPYTFPPLGAARYVTETRFRHTYDFYIKPPLGYRPAQRTRQTEEPQERTTLPPETKPEAH